MQTLRSERGSSEMLVMGLAITLIVLLAMPFVNGISNQTEENMHDFCVMALSDYYGYVEEAEGRRYLWGLGLQPACNEEGAEQGGGTPGLNDGEMAPLL